MQVSPLQLRQHFLTKVCVDQREKTPSAPTFGVCDFSNVEVEAALEHGAAVEETKDPRNFIMRLGMKFDSDKKANIPYDITVEMLGFFEVAPNIAKEKRHTLVLSNGAAMLYSAARETVASITGRFAKGIVILPGVNFIDDANKYEKELMKSKPKKDEEAKETTKTDK